MEEKNQNIGKPEKRWIVREIRSGRMTIGEACERVETFSKDPRSLIAKWMKQFESEIEFTLPDMTEKERAKVDSLQKRMKELEKQLEQAQMKNIALETMIDVAEEQFRIKIRKKAGPKQ